MPLSKSVEELRAHAEQCRDLLGLMPSQWARRAMVEMAQDYERRAAAGEALRRADGEATA